MDTFKNEQSYNKQSVFAGFCQAVLIVASLTPCRASPEPTDPQDPKATS